MKTIFKYTLEIAEKQLIPMPEGSKLLSVKNQNNSICIWAEVEDTAPIVNRKIYIVFTGHPIRFNTINSLTSNYAEFIDTTHLNSFVYHIYDGGEE